MEMDFADMKSLSTTAESEQLPTLASSNVTLEGILKDLENSTPTEASSVTEDKPNTNESTVGTVSDGALPIKEEPVEATGAL